MRLKDKALTVRREKASTAINTQKYLHESKNDS
jgi:hypothetical protein